MDANVAACFGCLHGRQSGRRKEPAALWRPARQPIRASAAQEASIPASANGCAPALLMYLKRRQLRRLIHRRSLQRVNDRLQLGLEGKELIGIRRLLDGRNMDLAQPIKLLGRNVVAGEKRILPGAEDWSERLA